MDVLSIQTDVMPPSLSRDFPRPRAFRARWGL